MSAYAVPAKDRAAQVRRMRQFLLSNAPVAFGAGAVLFLLYGIFRLPLVAVLGVIATGMGVMYLLALRAVQRGNIEAAVVARVAITLGFLGDVARAEGDRAAARALLAESLALWRQLGDECGVAQCLEGFAMLADPQRQPSGCPVTRAKELGPCPSAYTDEVG